MSDEHPADPILEAIRGLFNGDNIKQAIRAAWDRHNGPPPPANNALADMNKALNDEAVRKANESYRKAQAK